MRSKLLDGPIQRQILLLKLSHELDKRPDFGLKYDNNPDSEAQCWIARVSALMNRMGIGEGSQFRTSVSMSAQYWDFSTKSMQFQVRAAIEALKLEFDLFPEDCLGEVYDTGDTYRFLSDVIKIVTEAETEVLIVDQFLDSAIFGQLFSSNFLVPIKILCNRNYSNVKATAETFSSETSINCEVRASNDLHDRLMIIDRQICWMVGASIKDGGKKPTFIVPLVPEMAQKKLEIYERIWSAAANS